MIQRIQTLYLFVSFICFGIFFFSPFGYLITPELQKIPIKITESNFSYHNNALNQDIVLEYSMLPLVILVSLVCFISFFTIFLYKKRMLQVRLTVFNILLQIGCFGLLFYYLIDISKRLELEYSTGILIILPLISAILCFLAMRAILKDEALVQASKYFRK
mgnify:FL=1